MPEPHPVSVGEAAPPMSATPLSAAQLATQLASLQEENARLRAQLGAMEQLALARREAPVSSGRRWIGRLAQLLILLVGVTLGVLYVQLSQDDFVRGLRDGARGDAPVRSRP